MLPRLSTKKIILSILPRFRPAVNASFTDPKALSEIASAAKNSSKNLVKSCMQRSYKTTITIQDQKRGIKQGLSTACCLIEADTEKTSMSSESQPLKKICRIRFTFHLFPQLNSLRSVLSIIIDTAATTHRTRLIQEGPARDWFKWHLPMSLPSECRI